MTVHSMLERNPISLAPADVQVYELLRSEIIHGVLQPGSVLKLRELADRFQVSTTPVREALERLKGDGLCNQVPHRGTRVVELSLKEFEDIYAVRMGIEVEAAQRGVANLTEPVIRQIRESWEAAQSLWNDGNEPSPDQYFPLMNEVQMFCFKAAGMPRLQGLVHDYRRYAERYVRVALVGTTVLYEDMQQQEQFVIACEQRDVQRVGEVTREILLWVVRRLRGQLPE